MKINTNIYLILISFSLTSCLHNPKGIYSHCWGNNPKDKGCHYLELRDNSTFIYSDPFFVSGSIETKGYWSIKDNKLTLDYMGHNKLDSNKSEQNYPIKEQVQLKDDTIFIHNDKLIRRKSAK